MNELTTQFGGRCILDVNIPGFRAKETQDGYRRVRDAGKTGISAWVEVFTTFGV
jgi:hypothetical protein